MKIIVFDLDGTLTESKSHVGPKMVAALERLLKCREIAVVSGGAWSQFESQLISHLKLARPELLRFHMFPTSGTSFYRSDGRKWTCIYSEQLRPSEIRKIMNAFKSIIAESNQDLPQRLWGPQLENRGTQITFSALGQLAPVEEKKKWDPTFTKRLILIEKLMRLIPEFDIRTGGSTSIDVTRKGIDKRYAITQIEKYLGFSKSDMLFVGDAIFPGGNDYAVHEAGVECIETSGPEHTLRIIEEILK
jgi:hypothetical protein